MSSRQKPLALRPSRRLHLMRLESRRVLNGDVQIVALDAPVEGPTVDNSHADAAPGQDSVGEPAQPDLGDANLAHDLGFDIILPLDQPTADDVANALPDVMDNASAGAEPHHDVAASTNTDIHTPTHEIPASEIVTSFDTLAAPHDPDHSPIDSDADAGSVDANHPLLDSVSSHDSDAPDISPDHSPDTVTTSVAADSATSLEPSHDSQATTVARGETATWNEVEPVVVTNTTTINGTLIAPHGVEVDDGGVLKGSGTIDGEVTLLFGGTLSPGNSPGIMNVNGLTLMAGGTLDLDVVPSYQTAGVHYDQFNVTGSVSLGGATLHLVGGASAPSHGQILTIIQNDGSDAVTGTFAGLAEGGLVSVGLFNASISYHGGDGNDVTLTTDFSSSGPLTVTGTSSADLLQVRLVGNIIQTLNGSTVTSETLLAGLSSLTIVGNGGGDQLTVNYVDDATSDGFFNLPITFQGGNPTDPPGDRLVISGAGGGPFNTITHNFTNLHDGSVNIDGTVITYTGLEPITDNLSATNRVFNFNGGSETITLTTAAGANMTISSTLGESVTFANPTTSLTINAGTGNDNVMLTSINPGYLGTIMVDGGSGNDTITGPSEAVTWDVDAGTLNGVSFDATFSSMETLQGGSGADSFQVSASVANVVLRGGLGTDDFLIDAPLTGASLVDGQQGSDTLRGTEIDVAVITIVSLGDVTGLDGTEASLGANGWKNMETIIGNGAPGSSLTGRSITSIWTLNAPPTFSTYLAAAFTLNFSGFTSLQGGTRTDTFNIAGDYGPVTLNGGLGTVDEINVNTDITLLGSSGLSFNAEFINVGAHVISSVNGNQNYNGLLDLSGSTLSTSGLGAIVLGDNVSVGGSATSSITGRLDLGAVNRTFTVANPPAGLEIGALISNGALTKTGTGTLVLSSGAGPNTYAGTTTITNGIVRLADDDLLPGNVLIDSNGTLQLNGHSDTISGLSGTGALNNAAGMATLTVGDLGETSTFGGVISGALELKKIGAGTLTLAGINTYSGDTTISAGRLTLSGGDILPDGAGKGNVFINASAVLDLGGSGEDINGLSGTGTVDNLSGSGTYTLIVGDNNQTSTFDGVIQDTTGHIALQKIGTGTLTLAGVNQYSGATTVSAGTLSVTGSTATGSPVSVSSSATLTGTGTIGGTVSVANGGKLSPGLAVGTLATGSLALISGSQFVVDGNGDQLQVTGTVNLGNATLNATGLTGTSPIVLITNDGLDAVVGTFAGLAEGSTVIVGGTTYQISYRGGDGNDVVLRAGDTLISRDASGNLTITDINLATDDLLTIKSNTASSQFEISDPGRVLVTTIVGATLGPLGDTVFVPFSAVTGPLINVLTGDGSDSLTVDFSSGNFAKSIVYTAGSPAVSVGDRLTLTGGTFASVTHTFASEINGSINITNNNQISYTGLEEPIADNLTATTRTFTFTGSSETVTLGDVAGASNSQIDSTSGQKVTFNNPATTLAVNLTSGDDTLLVEGFELGFSANLTIDGDGNGNDNLTFRTNETNLGAGSLLVTDVVNVTFNKIFITTGNAVLSLTGSVSQGAGDTIKAAGLGLIVTGTGATTLTEANDVNVLAANTGGTINFNDINGLSVGSVTALGTTVTGITTSSDDVKLTTGGSLVIDDDVALNAGNLFLSVMGNVSQGTGDTITAAGLGLMVSGTTTLTEVGNNVTTLAADTSGTIEYVDATALTVGSVTVLSMSAVNGINTTDDDVKLTSAGLTISQVIAVDTADLGIVSSAAVTQSAAISGSGLMLMGAGSFTLTNAGNDFTTLAANTTGTISTIEYVDATALTVGTVDVLGMSVAGINTTDDDVKLTSAGLTISQEIAVDAADLGIVSSAAVTQSAAISGGGLLLMGAGPFTLTNSGNNFVTLAADTTETIEYVDATALTVGSVTVLSMSAVNGINTTDDDVKLTSTGLTISQAIAVDMANLGIVSSAAVTQSASITGGGLLLMGAGPFTLTNAGNDFVTLAADTTGTIDYVEVSALTIGSVTVLSMSAVNGINTTDDDVKLTMAGLTISQVIAVDAADLGIVSSAAVTQSAAITGGGLMLMGAGPFTLTNTSNNFVTLAANTDGAIEYVDASALAVGSVTVLSMSAVNGINTIEDDVKLTSAGLTISQAIGVDAADLGIVSSAAVTQLAAITGGGLMLMGAGPFTLTNTSNNFVTLAANTDGAIEYVDASALAVGSVTVLSMSAVNGINTIEDDVKLTSVGLTISQAIGVDAADLGIVSSAAVTQLAAITGGGLMLMGAGPFTLTNTSNNFVTLAANTTGTISTIEYVDATALTVGTVDVLGMSVAGINTTDDDVKLTSAGLTISQAIAVDMADLGLVSSAAVTQSAAITGGGLLLMGTGPFTLTNAANSFSTLAADTDGTINYTDINGLSVGTVDVLNMSKSGITTISDNVTLTTGGAGALTINEDIALGSASLTLDSAGAVTQGMGDAITAGGLRLLGAGPFTLEEVTNDVATLAANTNGFVSYRDASSLTIGMVTGNVGSTSGLTTTNDSVTVCLVTGNLSVANAITAGTETVRLQTLGGGISGPGTITADALGLRAIGSVNGISLTSTATDINTLAATTTGSFSFTDADGFSLGTVLALGCFTPVTGLTADGDLELCVVAGDISLTAAVNVTGTLRLDAAAGNVTQNSSGLITAADLGVRARNNIDLDNASNQITGTFAAISTTLGNVEFTDVGGFTVGTITAGSCLPLVPGITATSGNVVATSTGTITVNSGVSSTGGNILLIADNMNIGSGATINAAGQTVTLRQLTAAQQIDLGGADTAGTLGLTEAELDRIAAAELHIGDANSGAITVSSDINLSTASTAGGGAVPTLCLTTGSTVSATAGGIVVSDLSLVAAGAVNVTDLSTNVTNLAIDTSTGNVTFVDADGFTVTTVCGERGIDTDAGSVSLTATTGNLTVANTAAANDIDATAGITITLNGLNGLFTVSSLADLETTAVGITVTADNMTLTGTLTSSGQTVVLQQKTNGTLINLGGADAAGTLGLTDAELDNITASRLDVGNANSGAISVSSDIDLTDSPAITTLCLTSGSTVTATAGGIVVSDLAIVAAGAVNLADTTTNVTNLAIDTSTGNVTFVEASGLNVTTVCGLNGIDTDNGTVALTVTTGNLTVVNTAATNDLEATGDITVSLLANDALFTINTSADVETSAGSVIVSSDKMNLAGSVTTAGQTVTLKNSVGADAIDLGSATDVAAGTLELSDAELDRVTASRLIVGSATMGAITVTSNIDLTDSPTIATLHLITNSGITASAAGLKVANLAIGANDSLLFTSGTSDVDTLAVNTTGTVRFTDSDGLTVGTVDGVVGLMTTDDNVTLTTGGALTINDDIAVGTASLTLDSAGAVTQGSGDVITAGGLRLLGAGPFTLDEATNDVATLAANTTGALEYRDADTLTIGMVTGNVGSTSGITTTDDNVTVCLVTGNLAVSQNISTGPAATTTGVVRLQTLGGDISGAGTITADALGLRAIGSVNGISLTSTATVVNTLAAFTDGGFSFAAGFTLDKVIALGCFLEVDGLTAGEDIELCAETGNLVLNADVSAAGFTIRLDAAAGSVTQTAGVITATDLGVHALNAINLGGANNVTGSFAASTTSLTSGPIVFNDLGGFTVGTVTPGVCLPLVTGVKSANGDVTLTTTGGIILMNVTTAGGTHTAMMTAGAAINGSGLVTASSVDLNAATGIGNSTAVNLAASNITADTTNGDIDLNNALATATTVGSLIMGTGNITFDQTGGGAVNFTTATTGTGNITLTSAGANLTLGTINAGGTTQDVMVTTTTSGNIIVGSVTAADDVTLTSAGSILDNANDAVTDITGNRITLTAASGVGATASSLDTAADQLDVSVTGSGLIRLNETNAVELLAVDTANGSITVTSGGTITATVVVSSATDNNTNDISLTTTAGNILVASVNAGTLNDVELISAGAIEESGSDSAADVVGGDIRLVASSGIGSAAKIEINATNLAATTATGDISLIDTTGGVTITTIGTTVGIRITGGAVGDDISITSLAGAMAVNSNVTNVGGGHITLAAEGNAATADLTIAANVAATGGNGSVSLFAGDDLTVNSGTVSAVGSGAVSLSAGRDFNGGTPQTGNTDGDVTLASGTTVQSATGTLTLGATRDIVIAGTVQSTTGNIVVGADDAVQINVGGSILSTSGTIAIQVNRDATGSQSFTQASGTLIQTGNNTGSAVNIDVLGTGSAVIADIRANTAAGEITVRALGGAITDNSAGEAANLTAFAAALSAATGIGSAGDIDTNLSRVQFANSTSGAVLIQEVLGSGDNALEVLSGSNVIGNIDVRTTDGDLTISGAVTTTAAGQVTLVAGDSNNNGNGDLIVNEAITAATGQVTLTSAGNDVLFGSTGSVTTTTGKVEVNAGVTGVGRITMQDGSQIDAGAGLIDLNSIGDVTLGRLVTTNATPSAITIDTTSGALVDGGDTGGADIEANSGTLTITTRGAIGSAGADAIETQVGSLVATTTAGGIFLNETDEITLANVTTTNGAIDINAGGTITATNVVSMTDSDANDIRLTTTAGNILIEIVQITTTGTATAGDIFLTAVGAIEESVADAARDLIAQELHLVAGTGIGALSAIEFLANVVSADVSGMGDINLAADSTIDMTVTSLTSVGGNIDFELTGGANLFFTGPISSGRATPLPVVDGGNITVNHPDGKVTVDAFATELSSATGTGGVLTVSGATINRDILLGAGNITIKGKDQPAVSPGSPTMPRVEVPPPPVELPKFFVPDAIVIPPARNTTETISSGAVSSSILTDEFYELRRSNEDGTIETERLNDFRGESLLDQTKLEEFMRDRGDGDYEIWFETKDPRDGALIERRVMQFRFQDFHIVPTTSETPNLIPEQKLVPQAPANKPMPEQPEQPQGANGNDSLDEAADTMSSLESELNVQMLPVSEFVSHDVLHRIDAANSADMEQSESEVVTGERFAGAVMLLTAATWRRRRKTSVSDSSTFSKSARLARRLQR